MITNINYTHIVHTYVIIYVTTKLSFKDINHNHTCLKLTSLPTIIERSFVYPQRKPPLLLTDTHGKSVGSRMRRTKYRMAFRCIVLVSLKTPPPATLLPAKCHETSEIGKLIHIFSIDDNAADRPLSFHRIRI